MCLSKVKVDYGNVDQYFLMSELKNEDDTVWLLSTFDGEVSLLASNFQRPLATKVSLCHSRASQIKRPFWIGEIELKSKEAYSIPLQGRANSSYETNVRIADLLTMLTIHLTKKHIFNIMEFLTHDNNVTYFSNVSVTHQPSIVRIVK